MKTYTGHGLLAFLAASLATFLGSSAVWAGVVPASVKIAVNLTPAGSFIAQAQEIDVRGFLKKNPNGTFEAKDVFIRLDQLKTGIDLRDRHMKQKYLETEKFPEAAFSLAQAKDGKLTGDLKIRNVIEKIAGTYEVKKDRFVATFKTQMSKFSISAPKYMGVGADDEIEVTVDLPVVEVASQK